MTEARDWTHGTFMGATLCSETTAAAVGQVGVVRRDPMAMLPFIGYNAGDYFNHWITIGKDNDAAKLPKIFYVNWFRRDDDGGFLWPGFGENSRVLKWVIERIEGQAAAVETPIGHVPAPGSLDIDGLDMTEDAGRARPSRSTPRSGRPRSRRSRSGSRSSATQLPAVLWTELDGLKARLGRLTPAPLPAVTHLRQRPARRLRDGVRSVCATMRLVGGPGEGDAVTELGPEERELFETVATPLYEEVAVERRPRRTPTRGSRRAASSRPALDLLRLAQPPRARPRRRRYVPPSTRRPSSRTWSRPMSQQGAELLAESSQWARAFGQPRPVVAPLPERRARADHRVPRPRHRHLHRRRRRARPRRSCSPPSRRPRATARTARRSRRDAREGARSSGA